MINATHGLKSPFFVSLSLIIKYIIIMPKVIFKEYNQGQICMFLHSMITTKQILVKKD